MPTWSDTPWKKGTPMNEGGRAVKQWQTTAAGWLRGDQGASFQAGLRCFWVRSKNCLSVFWARP